MAHHFMVFSFQFIRMQENNIAGDLDREKRKLPEATFGAKNALLGYVFGVSMLSKSIKNN